MNYKLVSRADSQPERQHRLHIGCSNSIHFVSKNTTLGSRTLRHAAGLVCRFRLSRLFADISSRQNRSKLKEGPLKKRDQGSTESIWLAWDRLKLLFERMLDRSSLGRCSWYFVYLKIILVADWRIGCWICGLTRWGNQLINTNIFVASIVLWEDILSFLRWNCFAHALTYEFLL
jgi:hypothetical protein